MVVGLDPIYEDVPHGQETWRLLEILLMGYEGYHEGGQRIP